MLSGSTLLLLGVAWAIVLVPRALRDLRSSPSTTVTGFNDAMARLAVCDQRLLVVPTGSGQRIVVHPPRVRRRMVVQRRRAVLVSLLAATAAALALAVAAGGPLAWGLAGLVATALLGYCAALRRLAVQRAGSVTVVPLHPSVSARRRRVERGGHPGRRSDTVAPSIPAGPRVPAGRVLRFDATGDHATDDGLLFGRSVPDLEIVASPALAADAR